MRQFTSEKVLDFRANPTLPRFALFLIRGVSRRTPFRPDRSDDQAGRDARSRGGNQQRVVGIVAEREAILEIDPLAAVAQNSA